MANRVSQIAARVAVRPVTRGNGGTTAPRNAAKGGTTGLGRSRVAPSPGRLGQATPLPGGAPGGGSAGQPAAPPPGTSSLPWDAQYNLSAGGAEKAYGDKLAYLGSQRTVAKQNYGIDPGFNDYATNPYSRAALLRKSYDTAARGSNTSYAARGQLYAGSLANAQGANRSNYDLGYDSLNKEYVSSLGELDQQEAEAKEAKENAILEAGWRRLEGLANEPLEPEAAPGAAPDAGGGGGGGGTSGGGGGGGGAQKPKKQNNVNQKVKQAVGNARKAR